MGKFLAKVGVCVILAGCSEAVEPPKFQAPNDMLASRAYKAALKADWLDQPYDLKSLPKPGLYNHDLQRSNNTKMLANRYAPKVYHAFRRVKVRECEWKAMPLTKVPEFAEIRVSDLPSAAYRCGIEIHYQNNPPHGKKQTVDHNGWFFREGRKVVYLGKFKDPYFYSGG